MPATVQLTLEAKTISGQTLHFFQHVTGSKKTSHTATFDGLLTGTTYQVTAKATDAAGATRVEQGTFRTRSAVATVTFHKLTVIHDADKGGNAGEISFDYKAEDQVEVTDFYRRIDSGETVSARAAKSGRPGSRSPSPPTGVARSSSRSAASSAIGNASTTARASPTSAAASSRPTSMRSPGSSSTCAMR